MAFATPSASVAKGLLDGKSRGTKDVRYRSPADVVWGPPSPTTRLVRSGGEQRGEGEMLKERPARTELRVRRGDRNDEEARAEAAQMMRISAVATLRTRRW